MRPRVVLFNAVSLDGRVDWFAPDIGQFYGLAATFGEDATLAGSDTILATDGEMPAEDAAAFAPPAVDPADTRPLLVVPDSRGRVRAWTALRQAGYWRDVVALISASTPQAYREFLAQRHVTAICAGCEQVDLREALDELAARFGVRTVRVDSGGTLNGALLRAGLVDEVSVLIYPALVGGTTPKTVFRAPDLDAPEGVIALELTSVERLDNGVVWLRYAVKRK